jgi:hypothetical protein
MSVKVIQPLCMSTSGAPLGGTRGARRGAGLASKLPPEDLTRTRTRFLCGDVDVYEYVYGSEKVVILR